MFNRNTKSGFTLVEVLVVLAIIGVLAALLFPVFSRVREDARRATCQSNLQQIGLAIGQYARDNQGFYPPVIQEKLAWTDLLEPYVKNRQIFVCPSQNSGWRYDYGGDEVNTVIFTKTEVFIFGKNESTIKDETSAIILKDSTQNVDSRDTSGLTAAPNVTFNLPVFCHKMTTNGPIVAMTFPTVHAEGGNYGFADGHVKWLTPRAMMEFYCASGSQTP